MGCTGDAVATRPTNSMTYARYKKQKTLVLRGSYEDYPQPASRASSGSINTH